VAAIANQRPSLELSTLDIGFVVALHYTTLDHQMTSFTDEQLFDVYASVCRIVEPSAENVKQRFTYSLARLRTQRLLARVDGHGVVRQADYCLTRLASAIADFYVHDEALNRDSLRVLTAALANVLATVVAAAKAARTTDDWKRQVVIPLGVSITELVDGIERRQRGLDAQQEQFQSHLRHVVETDWFGSIERCQELLESTSATLAELGDMLMRDCAQIIDLLQNIVESAQHVNNDERTKGSDAAYAAAQRVVDQVDRIAAWGAARQRAWSEYFQYVHRYLRDVVRLDPSRALTARLRDQIVNGTKYSLTTAAAPSMLVLRTVSAKSILPAVKQPRTPREKKLHHDDSPDVEAILDARVQAALHNGASQLSTVTTQVNCEVEPHEHYAMTGRVAHRVVHMAHADSRHERVWTATSEELEIEDWDIRPKLARDPKPSEST
jgi:chromosome partition protein MukF